MNLSTGLINIGGLHCACGPLLLALAPQDWIRSLSESFVGFVVVPLVILTLAWFIYSVFLKKPLRARHIRVLRERRELREAAERGHDHED